VVGIGAPAGFFLERVAEALNAQLILPEHHEVANALGAVAGSVMVVEEVLVYPRLDGSGLEVLGYYVQTSEQRRDFGDEELKRCLAYARDLARERALGAAVRSGADNPEVVVDMETEGLDTYRIRARAMGNPRLAS
jgi:N-methylhydantoinase A/oxoprolinase/acetone carboxylase beta subunit